MQHIAYDGVHVVELIPDGSQRLVIGSHRLHFLKRRAHGVAVHGAVGRRQGLHDLLAVGESAVLCGQLLLLAGSHRRILNLIDLEAQEILLPDAALPVQGKALKLRVQSGILAVEGGCIFFQTVNTGFGVLIQNFQMPGMIQKGLVLMLAVNIDEKAGHLAQLCRRDRLVVNPADTANRRDLLRYDHQAVAVGRHIKRPQGFRLRLAVHREHQLYVGLVTALADHVLRGLAAQGNVHGADENGFSRAGLSGQNI